MFGGESVKRPPGLEEHRLHVLLKDFEAGVVAEEVRPWSAIARDDQHHAIVQILAADLESFGPTNEGPDAVLHRLPYRNIAG